MYAVYGVARDDVALPRRRAADGVVRSGYLHPVFTITKIFGARGVRTNVVARDLVAIGCDNDAARSIARDHVALRRRRAADGVFRCLEGDHAEVLVSEVLGAGGVRAYVIARDLVVHGVLAVHGYTVLFVAGDYVAPRYLRTTDDVTGSIVDEHAGIPVPQVLG